MSICYTTNMKIEGIVIQGKGIASGKNVDPETGLTNTIALQKPFFERAGVKKISDVFEGTINMDISPKEFHIDVPDKIVKDVTWDKDTTESFQFVEVTIVYPLEEENKREYPGYIYYPMVSEERPKLKSHPDTRIELLASKIEGLTYGKEIAIFVPDGKILIKDPPQQPQL